MDWISVEDRLPETQQRVLVCFTNSYGKTWVTCADYIAPKSVLEEEYMDDEYACTGVYDEENDCYWTNSGWYEHNYEPEINYFINDKVTHWMELPKKPGIK
jgi:hypothetical protein